MADAQKKDDSKAEATDGEATSASGSKKKLFIIIGAVVGLLLVGGGAAFFLMGGKSKPADDHAAAENHAEGGNTEGDASGKAEGGDGHAKGDAAGTADKGHEAGDGKSAEAKAAGSEKKEEGSEKKEEKGKEEAKKGEAEGGKDAAKDHKEGEKADKKGDGINFGETYAFKPFHLNLGNPLENHYVRMEVAVEFMGGETQKAEIEKRLVQLRDAVVSVVSRKSKEFLLGPDGKDQLRREILIRINRYMSKPIEAVYITDILIE